MNTPPDHPSLERPPNQPKRSAAERIAKIATLLRKVLPAAHAPTGMSPPRMPEQPVRSQSPSGPEVLPQVLRELLNRTAKRGDGAPVTPFSAAPPPAADRTAAGRSLSGSFSNQAGRREYKLFIPTGYRGQTVPLIVMLHGCTQSADDFAAGTQMNVLADEQTCLVVYPEQTSSANISKCWNWFNASHQLRGEGEPSIIAGITRQVMQQYAVDSQRVYVAGLSAGAAEAAILGSTYPDLYAAIGVHSGLPYGAARNLPSALAAMRNGAGGAAASLKSKRFVPTIVFHGDLDSTVHPSNGDRIITESVTPDLRVHVRQDRVSNGRAYTRTEHRAADGTPMLEQWVIHGAGHAWSGGSSAGSYTDPLGPDAAREMLRFFLEHAQPNVAAATA